MNYPPLQIKNLAKLIVGDDTPNKLTGKDLVDFFNEFAFNDDYIYPNVGIATADIGTGLSRTDYTRKRLNIMNERQQVDIVIEAYLANCADKSYAETALRKVLGKAPMVTQQVATTTSEFQPKSQFDDIPEGVPVVFVSYSWDNESHKEWVLKLSDDLRSKHSVYTLLDRYNPGGMNVVEFMDRGLRIAHRVVMVGTPTYKQKSESGSGTGGKYEGSIINTDIYYNAATMKFIPLLRQGESFKDAFTNIISVRNGYDFRDDSKYEQRLQELADDIYGRGVKAPALGKGETESVQSVAEPLLVPYKGERWLYELLANFSFFLMDDYFERMPCRFNMKVLTMFDTWNSIINSSVYHIEDKQLHKVIDDFFLSWKEIVEFGWRYYSVSNNKVDYVFYGAEFDIFANQEQEKAFEKIKEMTISLFPFYKAFVGFLDTNYPQIDREKVSKLFEEKLNEDLV